MAKFHVSKPATLGAILLGSAALLLGLDVAGTYVLSAPHARQIAAADPPTIAPTGAASPLPTDVPSATATATSAPSPTSTPLTAFSRPAVAAAPPNPVPASAHRVTAGGASGTIIAHHPTHATVARHATSPHPAVAKAITIGAAPAPAPRPARTSSATRVAVAAHTAPGTNATSPFGDEPPVPNLGDVRHFVMRNLPSHASVVSSATYAQGSNVVVALTVRDATHEWVRHDVVRRAGGDLAIVAEHDHTLLSYAPAPLR